MKTRVYAVTEAIPEDCDYLTAGKLYAVRHEFAAITSFEALDDDGFAVVPDWRNKAFNWTRLELPDIDPRDVAELYEAARYMWTVDPVHLHDRGKVARLNDIVNKIEDQK